MRMECEHLRIFLVRHGETDRNQEMRLQGRSNAALNEKGRQQARDLGEWFRNEGIVFSKVFASPLLRAVETAKIVSGGLEIHRDNRLFEMDYGPYEGADLRHPDPALAAFFRDPAHCPVPQGMESLASVTARMGRFMEDMKAEKQGNILVCTHAVALKGALEYLNPDSRGSFWSMQMGNCAVYEVMLDENTYTQPREIRWARN